MPGLLAQLLVPMLSHHHTLFQGHVSSQSLNILSRVQTPHYCEKASEKTSLENAPYKRRSKRREKATDFKLDETLCGLV